MALFTGLSSAHAILIATYFCARGNTAPLPQLQSQYPHSLPVERLLRIILTFLPESTEPRTYIPVIRALLDESSSSYPAGDDVDISPVKDLPESVVRKRVRKLRLLPLKHPDDEDSTGSQDLLTQFLIHRAFRIDSETSLQPFILELFQPFYEQSPALRTWLISCLLPLLRLNYEYYPDQDDSFSLETLESLDNNTAINVLLSMAGTQKSEMDLVRNLRGLVGPWMYGSNRTRRRRSIQMALQNSISAPGNMELQNPGTTGWQNVNEWLLSRSLVEPQAVVCAFVNWDGPEDVDLGGYNAEDEKLRSTELEDLRSRYGQTGIAIIYANADLSLDGSFQILGRVASFVDPDGSKLVTPDGTTLCTVSFDASEIQSASRAYLLQNALLLPKNPLTSPSASSLSFLDGLLLTLRTLKELGHPIPCRNAANICLHSNEETQLFELRGIMASIVLHLKHGRDWRTVRKQLLWLRDWKVDHENRTSEGHPAYHGLLWRISRDVVEAEIFKTMMEVREYESAVDIYMNPSSPLSSAQVENAVKEAIFAAYDNASNGNRTRGKMLRAYEILQAFQPYFPDSTSLKEAQALIAATHSLSFYSLTLQHGVPFLPVNIRVHPDPLSLIEKVLDQNPKSYTKLDDLIGIGRNLVAASFSPRPSDDGSHYSQHPTLSHNESNAIAERRIMSLAISSALSSNDFGTAYSYILTRLTPPSHTPSSLLTNPTTKDDISWRAVYNAGRYRPPTSAVPPTLQSQITQLSQRMELLSLALVLAPNPDPLPEILGAWRRCDEELSSLHARETEEEELWDARGDRLLTSPSTVPGGFSSTDNEQDIFETRQQHAKRSRAQRSRLNHEEAPMGLFEVARGAARALHKNTFPLRSVAGVGDSTSASASASASDLDLSASSSSNMLGPLDDEESHADGRVRKRDVVSNMVTGGLASGIGWVLGAQPVNR